MPVTPHGRQQRKSGGVATKPEARRIAANIAKLPERCGIFVAEWARGAIPLFVMPVTSLRVRFGT
jgi:hypothetical protein